MLTRAPVSDEMLCGWSVLLATAAAALLVLIGLGVFSYGENASRTAERAAPQPPAGVKERPPYPTTISLLSNGSMLVGTNPLESKPFPREEVGLVFAEMLSRNVTPPLIVRCHPGVEQASLMDILVKARDAGIHDIRLVLPREMEKP